jgi:glycosyltransferase involved in cell wall biosynthesis
VQYDVIRNVPQKITCAKKKPAGKFILYQGAVNEARGLENLILAMKHIDVPLYIYGKGNIFESIAALVKKNNLECKVIIKGMLSPEFLSEITSNAYIGINLVEPIGLNQFYSLANKFFDYIQAGLPQLTMNFPEYKKINDAFEVALLADSLEVNEIVKKLNLLLNDTVLYERLEANCLRAKEIFIWEREEIKLIDFYRRL